MRGKKQHVTTWMALLALTFAVAPAAAEARPPVAALEGRLTALDGRAARGWHMQLIDAGGSSVARATADDRGHYAFADLEPGTYALGLESPEGHLAPVAAPPVRLAGGQRLRRDVKLVTAGPETQALGAGPNYGLGLWWAGLSSASKAWVVIGGLAVVGVTVVALTDDDEPDASPF